MMIQQPSKAKLRKFTKPWNKPE